jgi:hypothetical protein
MQHRKPASACPLCLLWGLRFDTANRDTWGRQHAHAALLWEQWDGRKDWPERVARVAQDLLGVDVSAQQARAHFNYHRVEQPHPPDRLDRRRALAEAQDLSPTAKGILTALYRQRLLSRSQVIDLFFTDHSPASARTLANRELQALCRQHFAYRFYPDPAWERYSSVPNDLLGEVFYLFGRNGGPYIEDVYGARVWSDAATTMARQVGRTTFVHDWRANNVYVSLVQALERRQGQLELPNGEWAPAYAKRENWYGARLIGMRMWSRRLMRELDMRPDGFATLSLERSGYAEGSLPSTQLPFFYEFDNESKQAHVVAEQMLAYHHLALSGEAGKRFPALAVDGYAVPMIMVFRGRGRVEEVGRSFLRRAKKEGYREGGAPIFMVREEDWNRDPFADGILHLAWNAGAETLSLLQALLRSSARLLETRTLTAQQVITVDPKPSPRRQAAKDAAAREARKTSRAQAQVAGGQRQPPVPAPQAPGVAAIAAVFSEVTAAFTVEEPIEDELTTLVDSLAPVVSSPVPPAADTLETNADGEVPARRKRKPSTGVEPAAAEPVESVPARRRRAPKR